MTRRSDGGSTALQRIPTRFTVRLVGVTAEPSYPGNVYRAVTQDAPLELVREPNNEYDANAVVVRRADTRERLGYLRANVANVLAPHLDAGEIWVVDEKQIGVKTGSEANPGLTVHLVHVVWVEDPELRPPTTGKPRNAFEAMRRRNSREDPRAFAERMTERSRDLAVRLVAGAQYAVPSESQPGRYHSVVVDADDHGLVHCLCDCQSGNCRPNLPIACRHGAAVITHLVDVGYLRRIGHLAYRVG